MKLTGWQRDWVADALEGHTQRSDTALAAFVALLKLCGPRALADMLAAPDADAFSMWSAAGPDLQKVLKRDGATITCPELKTASRSAA